MGSLIAVWFKVDDTLAFHRKALKAGNEAMGVWVRAGSLCGQQLTDGVVEPAMVKALGRTANARRLVDADLWHGHGHECDECPDPPPGHFVFHEWDHRNPLRSDVEAKRKTDAQRLADWRERKRREKQEETG